MKPGNEQISPISELNDIISLAESSASSIDSLEATLSKQKNFVIKAVVFSIFSFGVFVFLLKNFPEFTIFSKSNIFRDSGREIFTSFFTFFLLSTATRLYFSVSEIIKIRKTLETEYDIQSRLVLLIDSQMRRIRFEEIASPVTIAATEIRLRRLSRTK